METVVCTPRVSVCDLHCLPLKILPDPYTRWLSSIGFSAATSWRGIFPISTSEWDDLERILHGAQSRGFQTRLWSPPRWPVFVRERVWRTLIDL